MIFVPVVFPGRRLRLWFNGVDASTPKGHWIFTCVKITRISHLSPPDLFFFQAQNAPKPVFDQGRWGSSRRFLTPLSRLGGDTDTPSPCIPLSSAPRFSGPVHKFLLCLSVARERKTASYYRRVMWRRHSRRKQWGRTTSAVLRHSYQSAIKVWRNYCSACEQV